MGDEEELEVMAAAAVAKCDGRDVARRVFVYVAWVYDHVRRSTVILKFFFVVRAYYQSGIARGKKVMIER